MTDIINDDEFVVKLGSATGVSDSSMRRNVGYFGWRRELQVSDLVVLVLTLFSVLRLCHGFLWRVCAKLVYGKLFAAVCFDSFSIEGKDSTLNYMSINFASGIVD